jgi:gliding motility-associated-like protein
VKILYLLLALLLLAGRVQAQRETYNWRFSTSAGLNFPASGPPVAISTGRMLNVGEACSAASDAAGSLRCYSDGVQVWDRTNTPMPNGRLRPDNYATSATQGALLVPNPGNAQEYYLFTVDPISIVRPYYGLRYSVVEMGLRGGLGDIGSRKDVAVPLPDAGIVPTEKLLAVLLPNGRDYWILVHGLGNNKFYSFLLTAAGVQPVPVASSAGAVHRRSGGYMRLSPDAQLLAVAELPDHIELFNFDNASGKVTSARSIALPNVPKPGWSSDLYTYYGLEFSADGSKLYTTSITAPAFTTLAQGLYQLDLAQGDALTFIGLDNNAFALLRGPDDRIYVAHDRGPSLSVITAPNAPGMACGLQAQGQPLAPGTTSGLGLPNFPVVPTAPNLRLALRVASPNLCLGQGPAAFSAAVTPVGANAVFTWNFGDPAAGAANAATGSAASHTYAAAGSYVVTVSAALAGGGTLTARQTITVAPTPTLRLAPHQQVLCAGLPLVIEANAQPDGTTYRWHDGLTTAAREVSSPGRYVLTVTSPGGCAARDSVDVREPLPTDDCIARRVPNIITPNGDGQNDTFVLGSLLAPSWSLTIFNRWGREVFQQASYDNNWDAPSLAGGVYYYLLLNPATGARLRGWVLVSK